MGYTLKNIVKEWAVENGKSEAQLARLYIIALSGLRELHLDVNGIIKVVELCINDNDTVDLPNDFINYRKIGIVGADGRIHSMSRDTDISLQPACGIDGRNIQQSNGLTAINGLPFTGSFWGITDGNGGVFGLGGGNNMIGYFRYNRKTNQLWLSGLSSNSLTGALGVGRINSVVVEYIADINSDGDDFIVHPYAIDTIKNYISWRYVNGDRNTGTGEKEMRRNEYFNSLRICKNRYGSSTPSEWADALRKSNTGTVRF